MPIQEYKTFSWQEIIDLNTTKSELAKLIGIDCSFDAALPSPWLKEFVERHNLEYHEVIFSTFMVYAEGDYFGTPFSACDVIQQAINKDKIEWIADELADKYTLMIADEIKRLTGVDLSYGVSSLSRTLINTFNLMKLKEK